MALNLLTHSNCRAMKRALGANSSPFLFSVVFAVPPYSGAYREWLRVQGSRPGEVTEPGARAQLLIPCPVGER